MKSRRVAGIFLVLLFVSSAFSQSKTTRALSGAFADAIDSSVSGAKATATNGDINDFFDTTAEKLDSFTRGERTIP